MQTTRNIAYLLGSRVDVTNLPTACARILELASQHKSAYICFATAHMLVAANRNGPVQEAYAHADMISPDGVPLMWCQRLLGHRGAECVSGPAAMPFLLRAAAEQGTKVGFFGGRSETLRLIRSRLQAELPALQIAYMHAPPFRTPSFPEERQDLDDITAAGVELLFVGLGSPKQECWMRRCSPALSCVCLGVGAAFEFFSGEKQLPPDHIQRFGLNWLVRLCQEPRRLLWRNLSSPIFVACFLLQLLTGRGGQAPRNIRVEGVPAQAGQSASGKVNF
jgi:N-acetylglucosaminyldiphosphoundecaprenol N-acetyl-beta-D-mannosaminyltransferase